MEDVVAALVRRLRAAGCVFAEDEAAILLRATDDPVERERLLRLRIEGQPLEHVVGWAEFGGLRIAVGEDVFVPRRRSEFLARRAAETATDGATVVDMCCGAGALGLVIHGTRNRVELHAVDSDTRAVAFARANLATTAACVYLGDLFQPLPSTLRGAVDLIIAVTPYVPTGDLDFLHREARLYEPASTHDGGADGLTLTRRILAEAADWLAPGGCVMLEVSEEQAPRVVSLARRRGLTGRVERDEDLDATIVIGLV